MIRPEATGYGAVYFAQHMSEGFLNEKLEGKTALVSGSGNVAQYAIEKLLDLNAKPVTVSDSKGTLYVRDGIDRDLLGKIMLHKNELRLPLEELGVETIPSAEYFPSIKPWRLPNLQNIDLVFPCATQNEVDETDAVCLFKSGAKLISEGANMPCDNAAIEVFKQEGVLYGPGKAANAGGVAVSGLEMAQNAQVGPRGWRWQRICAGSTSGHVLPSREYH